MTQHAPDPLHAPDYPARPLALALILATAFLNTMGMTLVFPVLPYIVARYTHSADATAMWVGVIASAFALCALLAAPALGALSDRVGRRPVLLASLVGSAIGFVVFGVGGSLGVLLLGRIIDGLTGGNISTIFAYVADITPPHLRGKRFGLVGGVFGLGFMFGPAIGGLLSRFGLSVPVFVAAGFTLLAAALSALWLPESLDRSHRRETLALADLHPFRNIGAALRRPGLRVLLLALLLINTPMTGVHNNVTVFVKDLLSWGPEQIGLLLFGVGVLDILCQGVLVGVFLPRLGERRVAVGGLIGQGVGYVVMAIVAFALRSPVLFVVGNLTFAASEGITGPAMNSLISQAVSPSEQGWVQGGAQSMNSAARAIGPLLASALYAGVAPGAPYVLGFVVIVGALAFVAVRLRTGVRAEELAEAA